MEQKDLPKEKPKWCNRRVFFYLTLNELLYLVAGISASLFMYRFYDGFI